jgi:hypothetical protein
MGAFLFLRQVREIQREGGEDGREGNRTHRPRFSGYLPRRRKTLPRPNRQGWRWEVQKLYAAQRPSPHYSASLSRERARKTTFGSSLTSSGRSHGSISVEGAFDMRPGR